MATSLARGRVLFVGGLILATVLAVSCASSTKAPEGGPAPAPAGAPAQTPGTASPAAPTAAPAPAVPAPVTAPASPPGATLAPTPAKKAEAGITVANLFAAKEVPGGPRINPAAIEKEKGVQELLRYHLNRLPLWTKAKYGGQATFVGSVTGQVDPTINPLTRPSRRNQNWGRLLYYDQGLCSWVGRDADFSVCKGQYAVNDAVLIVPGVFQRWEQPDPLTFIFHVRKGVLWPAIPPMLRTDREVTAEDVKWYLDIQQREGFYRDSFVDVKANDVLDRYTLKVTLVAPLPDFLRGMTQHGIGIFPKECYDDKGCLGSKLITPGPWLVKEHVVRQKVAYEKNPEFYLRGLPYVDLWVILEIPDPTAQKSLYLTGQVTSYRTYDKNESASVAAKLPGGKIHLQYNQGGMQFRPKLDGPFADVRVRRALMLGLDLRSLWELAGSGNGNIPTEFARDVLGYGKPFYFALDNASEWYQYNPERAKRLLAEAGYPNGFSTKMTTSSSSGVTYELILGAQSMWKRNLNVDMSIQVVDSQTYGALAREKKWEGLYFGAFTGGWTDGNSGFLPQLKGSVNNYQDIVDPVFEELYVKARRELDPAKRVAFIWQAEQREMDQIYSYRINNHYPYDHMQPWEMNGASHVWDFYWSLGVAWVTMIDPDKVRK